MPVCDALLTELNAFANYSLGHTHVYIEPASCCLMCWSFACSSWFELFLACAHVRRPTNRRARGAEEELRALEQSAKSLGVSALKVHEQIASTEASSKADPAAAWPALCFTSAMNSTHILANL